MKTYATQSAKVAQNGRVYVDRHALPPYPPETRRAWYDVEAIPSGGFRVIPAGAGFGVDFPAAKHPAGAVDAYVSGNAAASVALLSA